MIVIFPWKRQECLEGDSLKEIKEGQVEIERRITIVIVVN